MKINQLAIALMTACCMLNAHAQDAAKPAAEKSPTQLKQVTVTAEKKVNVAQKTPITMSVIDSDTLRQNSVGNMADLAAYAPSVSIDTRAANTMIGIRGVSSRDSNEFGDSSVAVSLDGFTLQSLLGLNTTMFDLERVEILRGPQGTLVGRNATGGAMNIITAKPEDVYSGSVAVELGDYGAHNTAAHVNLPINDILKLRVAMQTRDHDGYRNNGAATDGDDEHSRAGRLHVQVDPSSRWTMLFTGEYSKSDGVGGIVQAVPYSYNDDGSVVLDKHPDIPGDGKSFFAVPGTHTNIKNSMFRYTTTYDMDWASLTYLGGYRDFTVKRLYALGGAEGTDRQNLAMNMNNNPTSVSHELRLSSAPGSKVGWQVGGFYFDEKQDLFSIFQDYEDNLYGKATDLQTYKYHVSSRSEALFGQVSIPLADDVSLELGARRTSDKKHRDGYTIITGLSSWLSSGVLNYVKTPVDNNYSSDKNTYHAGLNWQVSPSNMLYAKFDTGYKGGGYSDETEYGPETVYAYEIGSKNRFLDNRLELNLSAYYYDYKDQQVSQAYVTSGGLTGSEIVNAGKSRYRGVEMEGVWLMTDVDKLNFYIGYNDAKYTDFVTSLNGVNTQLAGNVPPQAPKLSTNIGWQHDWSVWQGLLSFKVQTHYESKSYFTIYNYTADQQKAYHRTDLSLGYYPSSLGWSVEAYVRNIEDKRIIADIQDPSSTTYLAYRYQWMPPRTYGVRFTFNW